MSIVYTDGTRRLHAGRSVERRITGLAANRSTRDHVAFLGGVTNVADLGKGGLGLPAEELGTVTSADKSCGSTE